MVRLPEREHWHFSPLVLRGSAGGESASEVRERQRAFRDAKVNKDFWKARYEDINNFEKHLPRKTVRRSSSFS